MSIIALLTTVLLMQINTPDDCPQIADTFAEDAKWMYEVTDSKGNLYKTYQYKVEGVSYEDERTVYSIKYKTLNKKGKEEDSGYRNIIAAGDQYLVNIETIIIDYKSDNANYITLPCEPKAGDPVPDIRKVTTYTYDNLGQKSYISNKVDLTDFEFEEKETITTPMGESECIKLTYKVRFDKLDFSYTDWIDRDHRVVRREILDKKGEIAYAVVMTEYEK